MPNHKLDDKASIEARLNSINDKLSELSKEPGFLSAKELIIDIVSLLGIQVSENKGARYEFLQDAKFRKNEPWFDWHSMFTDKRAGELLNHVDDIPVEIKMYWLNKVMPSRVTGVVHFTDNYEDSTRTRKDERSKVGIDCVINAEADGIVIALSNYGVVRVLEIKDRLNNTQKKILSDWMEIGSGDYKNKREFLHKSLWNSFEIKTVNENFYSMISQAFTILKQHLEDNKIFKEEDAKQFSNRLIGRLLFVWFLKKKGFIFEEKIPYFDTEGVNDSEYYITRLGRLFFDTLNKPIEIRDALKDDLKTPYLNGGLFYTYDNDTPNKGKLSFPEGFFAELYKNLNEYNFTTDESTPDFEQVAIDPEMLGRIFENLLASMRTETGEQANKANGAFYTPREIVQYMCRESIREHLYNNLGEKKYGKEIDKLIDISDHEWALDEAIKVRDISKKDGFNKKVYEVIKDIKILDPACGSGAFPLGMLQNLLRIYLRLDRNTNEYQTKINILENNIYGVDIEPMAVEISRLRSFLALVVDQEYNIKNNNGGVAILPNLEFKFVCANTLFKLDGQQGLMDSLGNINLKEELINLKRKYFKADWKKKQKLETELEKNLSQPGLHSSKKQKQLMTYHPIHQIASASFYDPILMHDVETGFDLIIGNPPYIQLQDKEKIPLKYQKELEDENYETFAKMGDIYCLFYERAHDLIKDKGLITFITSNKWMRTEYGKKLREFFINKTNPLSLIDFSGFRVFNTALVDTNIIIFQKATNNNKMYSCHFTRDYHRGDSIKKYFENNKVLLNKLDTNSWFIGTEEALLLKKKIEKIGTKLKDWDLSIRYGIKSGYNKAFIIKEDKRNDLIKEDKNSENIISPVITGKDMDNYLHNFSKLYIIATFPTLKLDINKYSAVEKYLASFGDKLKQIGGKKHRKKSSNKWYETQDNIAYYEDFNKDKVVWLNLNRKWKFALVEKGYYVEAALSFIPSDKYAKFLIGVLSSKLHLWYFKTIGTMFDDGGYACKIVTINKFPIPLLDKGKRKKIAIDIEKNVDEIIKIKKAKDNLNIEEYVNNIDELVYKLYALKDEEINIIKTSIKL
jgi:methylase of polypeptide subunit release factors